MNSYSIGDQARAFALQTASHRLKTTLATLADEIASGEVADLGQRLQGNTQMLADLETRIALGSQFERNATEAASMTRGVQDVLEAVRSQVGPLALSLVAEPFSETTSLLAMRAGEVSDMFQSLVADLNGAVGGRFLFAGLNSDAPPLIPAAEMLDALELATAGLTTAADVAGAVADWFDSAPGDGGFMDIAYRGTSGNEPAIAIGGGVSVSLSTTAASPAIREVLKGLATAALVDRGLLAGQYHEQRDLMQRGGQIAMNNNAELLAEMGRVGQKQQLIERATAENSGARATWTTMRNNLRAADPYETAGAMTQVQVQLETLYAVTARLSKLKLVDYLR